MTNELKLATSTEAERWALLGKCLDEHGKQLGECLLKLERVDGHLKTQNGRLGKGEARFEKVEETAKELADKVDSLEGSRDKAEGAAKATQIAFAVICTLAGSIGTLLAMFGMKLVVAK